MLQYHEQVFIDAQKAGYGDLCLYEPWGQCDWHCGCMPVHVDVRTCM